MIAETGQINVCPIGESNVHDFRGLLARPPEGWCWCVAWEVESWDEWGSRSSEQNRALREDLWSKGRFEGYLIYKKDEPIGWVRCGPSSLWPKLGESRGVKLSNKSWTFTCFGMRPEYRRLGYVKIASQKLIEDLAETGARHFVAIPKKSCGFKLDDSEAWNGPEKMFIDLGFQLLNSFECHSVYELRLPLHN